jgi:hypothetical protein
MFRTFNKAINQYGNDKSIYSAGMKMITQSFYLYEKMVIHYITIRISILYPVAFFVIKPILKEMAVINCFYFYPFTKFEEPFHAD